MANRVVSRLQRGNDLTLPAFRHNLAQIWDSTPVKPRNQFTVNATKELPMYSLDPL